MAGVTGAKPMVGTLKLATMLALASPEASMLVIDSWPTLPPIAPMMPSARMLTTPVAVLNAAPDASSVPVAVRLRLTSPQPTLPTLTIFVWVALSSTLTVPIESSNAR